MAGYKSSNALLVQYATARLLPLLVPHPVALEGGKTCHDAASYPAQVLPFTWGANRN